MKYRALWACLALSTCAWVSTAAAQEAATDQTTVASEPQAKSGGLARAFGWGAAMFDGAGTTRDGFYPEFGGLIPGSGITIGPGYRHQIFGDRAYVDASAAASLRRYAMMQSTIAWPRLMADHLTLGGQVKYQDFTQVNYFGIGNDTPEANQTDYRIKYYDAAGFAAVRPTSWLTVSGRAGAMHRADIGRGRATWMSSVEERFDDASAPALIAQPNYVHADLGVEADTRDVPGYPSSGGHYRLSAAAFHDRTFGRYSFRRAEAEAAQYIPLGDRSVIAVRGRLDAADAASDQQIPFYMLPSLGSSQSLRGYDDYRFRDRNAALATAEYRVRVARPVDVAVFYDAGAVAPTVRALTRGTVHNDYGVGLRLHSRKHLIARLDVARSPEGTHFGVSFTPSLGFTRPTVAPYVP